MISSSYKAIFEVATFHSFFENDKCPCVEFIPSPETTELFNRFPFKQREKECGFSIYLNSRVEIKPFLNYVRTVTGVSVFEFGITVNEENFYLFSDLPVNWNGSMNFNSASDANSIKSGKVQLAIDLVANDDSIYAGTLKIHFDDLLDAIDTSDNIQYEIRYQARSTQWRYYIINKNNKPYTQLSIESKYNIEFEEIKNIKLENNEEAVLFSTGAKIIPLSLVPKYQFDLVDNTNSKQSFNGREILGRTIISGLPSPNPGKFKIINNDGIEAVASLMYTYI